MSDYTLAMAGLVTQRVLDRYEIHQHDHDDPEKERGSYVISPGQCEGELVGGNLSLLAALSGTEFALDATDKLLFIEDIGEKPYRVDRMLTQLLQSSSLQKARGIILGRFIDCEPEEGDSSLTLKETLIDRLSGLGIPVYYGFSFGHVDDMCTIPVGIKAHFDTANPLLTLMEPTVN